MKPQHYRDAHFAFGHSTCCCDFMVGLLFRAFDCSGEQCALHSKTLELDLVCVSGQKLTTSTNCIEVH